MYFASQYIVNENTTNESASMACSNVYGCESWTLRKNEDVLTLLR